MRKKAEKNNFNTVNKKSGLNRETPSERIFNVFNGLLMICLMFVTIYPLWYVIVSSFSDSNLLMMHIGFLFKPLGFNLEAYKLVFQNPNVITGYANTILIVVSGTLISLLMTSFGAYVLSRKSFPFKRIMMFLIVFTMYFSGGMIPRYLLIYNTLGLGDNRLSLILPVMISTYNLIVMRTSFDGVPAELEESARIDGANDFLILFKIILPVSLPVVAVMVLFYGVTYWNSWFDAMLFLRDREKYPLQLILREILILNSTDSMMVGDVDTDRQALGESIKYATIVVATLPILFVYPCVQKYFMKGIMVGAVKG